MIEIKEKRDCTGCSGCNNICPTNSISMCSDKEGFIYPIVNTDTCKKCKKCINVCPILNIRNIKNSLISYACYNKDENIRKNSSSGGIFTLIAEMVIKNNGIVFGAKFNKDFDVEHGYTDNLEGIKYFRGSKYVQSIIGNSFNKVKEFLDIGKTVLFSGTPCQVGGLKSFLGKDYDNLICLDLVCHGVPSPLCWNKYKNEISDGKKIINVNFRDKTYGWKNYSLKIDFEDGSSYIESGFTNKYIRGFVNDIYLRPSCYSCKFKSLDRQSDITLADFWGIENIDKSMDDEKGTSFIIVNSQKGSDIINNIMNDIEIKLVNLEKAVTYNMSIIQSSRYNKRRKYFFKNIHKFEFNKLVDKSLKLSMYDRIKIKIYPLYELLKKYKKEI